MAVKLTLKNGKELKQDFIAAGTVRKVMKFGQRLEKGDVSELEAIEKMTEMVVELFPAEKKLEDYLWENYEMQELIEFAESALTQVTSGGKEVEPSTEE